MNDQRRSFKIALLALGLCHLVYFCLAKSGETLGIAGLLYANGSPVGGDFINLWSAARLVLAARTSEIYDVDQFMSHVQTLTGAATGLRIWAYPPHSLLVIWPFGLVGFYAALGIWSEAGLAVLFLGARRFGFDRLETGIILTSPATVLNFYYGQSGSFAAGLLLLALSPRKEHDPLPVGAAALLTLKPQTGFLLPVLWLFQRRWWMIAATAVASLALIGLAVAVFGAGSWRDYITDTLPMLGLLERQGSGPFIAMIPSAFMALRILPAMPIWRSLCTPALPRPSQSCSSSACGGFRITCGAAPSS
ncbi:MAG: DUF2029 domain-containing protein [Pseudomonadota bacterium]|nr:DUF2029 domain-containing protein [Pseudomonadota bacterium]